MSLVCIRLGFSWNARTFARPKQLIYSSSDVPCLADEIAKPRPEMNIKVAAFTVSEKSINTYCIRFGVLSLVAVLIHPIATII